MTKPPETRRVEVDLKALEKLAHDLELADEWWAASELRAALASGADTPDWQIQAHAEARATEAERRLVGLRAEVTALRDELQRNVDAYDGEHFIIAEPARACSRMVIRRLDRLLTGPAQGET